ncbi:MAG: EscU/YscU/HrcU family type III secretion system export apparatus switch protein [Gammaproteobacteria bacterium]|nr:EscU/YscU/HrcU family type III secretion system export apparatus switch protein [Gammaproteobacteria bacterium]
MKKIKAKGTLAIALEYNGKEAPRVTAKGAGSVAEEILKIAAENGIPLHEDPGLVQILSKIELGDEIPDTLYQAIAEVLAFVFLISGKAEKMFGDRHADNHDA